MCCLSRWSRIATAVTGLVIAGLLAGGCPADGDGVVVTQNIMQMVQTDPSLTTLTNALQMAGLAGILRNSTGPYTLFAPSDAAWGSLPESIRTNLLDGTHVPLLRQVLQGHIVQGAYPAGSLRDGQILTSLSGEPILVRIQNGIVGVGGASIDEANIPASNGLIHVIGGVILPPGV